MLDYRTPAGISMASARIGAINVAAATILNRSVMAHHLERINVVTLLLELAADLAFDLDKANDPELDNRGQGV